VLTPIYLYWFDIDEQGNPVSIPGGINRCLILYTLFFRCVVLQSSSALKRPDLAAFFSANTDLFKRQDNHEPLISFSLEKPNDGFQAYLDGRLSTLSRLKKSGLNKEYSSYKDFDAPNVAKELDRIISAADIYSTVQSVDGQFRGMLSNFSFQEPTDIVKIKKVEQTIHDCATKDQVCQTFEMLRRSEIILQPSSSSDVIDNLGKSLRSVYFEANAAGNMCVLPRKATVTDYSMIWQYSRNIGLSMLFEGDTKLHISSTLINEIKANTHYRFLIDAFFAHCNDGIRFRELIQHIPHFNANLRGFKRYLEHLQSVILN